MLAVKTIPFEFDYAGRALTAQVSIGFVHAGFDTAGAVCVRASATFEGFAPGVVSTEPVLIDVSADSVAAVAAERGLAERAVDRLRDTMKLSFKAVGLQCFCKGVI